MSRRAVNPVERTFLLWAALSADQKREFDWSVAGYLRASAAPKVPTEPRKRKPKPPTAATGE